MQNLFAQETKENNIKENQFLQTAEHQEKKDRRAITNYLDKRYNKLYSVKCKHWKVIWGVKSCCCK